MDELRDAIIRAYIEGATDVHNNWQEDRDPCFREAAGDYADSIDLEAIATEARRAETVQQGSVHKGAGPKDIAQ